MSDSQPQPEDIVPDRDETLTRQARAQVALDAAVRQLAFAGIAVVWIFRGTTGEATTIASPVRWSLLFFVLSLAADFLGAFLATELYGWSAMYQAPSTLRGWSKGLYGLMVTAPTITTSGPSPQGFRRLRFVQGLNRLAAIAIMLGYIALAIAIGRAVMPRA